MKDAKGEALPEKSVEFKASLRTAGDGFSGEITETTQAKPEDPKPTELRAFVKGAVGNNGEVLFTKEYDGSGGWSHQVKYTGELATDRKSVKGNWLIRSETGEEISGRFEMKSQSK